MVVFNGEPIFPFGFFLYWKLEADQVAFIKANGFNSIVIAGIPCYSASGLDNILAAAEEESLYVIMFMPLALDPNNIGGVANRVASYKDSPAVLGYIPADEAVNGDMSYVDLFLAEAKEEDPYRLVYPNHNTASFHRFRNRPKRLPGNLLSFDRYPNIGFGSSVDPSIYTVGALIRGMTDEALESRKPIFAILSHTDIGGKCWPGFCEFNLREPSMRELEFQTYITVIEGARALFFYINLPKSTYVLAKLRSLNEEIQSLVPALASVKSVPKITANNDMIRYLLTREETHYTLITVNRSMESEQITFDLSSLQGLNVNIPATVSFEDRTLSLNSEASLSDTFAPFQRHVYLIPLSN